MAENIDSACAVHRNARIHSVRYHCCAGIVNRLDHVQACSYDTALVETLMDLSRQKKKVIHPYFTKKKDRVSSFVPCAGWNASCADSFCCLCATATGIVLWGCPRRDGLSPPSRNGGNGLGLQSGRGREGFVSFARSIRQREQQLPVALVKSRSCRTTADAIQSSNPGFRSEPCLKEPEPGTIRAMAWRILASLRFVWLGLARRTCGGPAPC